MDELYRLRDDFAAGQIDRRRFLKSALALGLTVEAARTFVGTAMAQAGQGVDFLEGQAGFPVLRRDYVEQGFRDIFDWDKENPVDMMNYTLLRLIEARDNTTAPGNWQERAWLAYALSVVYAESWTINRVKSGDPGFGWTQAKFATEAETLANAAFNDAGGHYDAYWARAAVYANVNKPDLAVADYKQIKDTTSLWNDVPKSLRRDFRCEYADALVHAGDVDKALVILGNRQPRRDWHRHQWAWCHFIKSRRETNNFRKIWRLDLALGYLRQRRRRHSDIRHLALADLLSAACYGQKSEVYRNASKPQAAKAQKVLARQALRRFKRKYRTYLGGAVEEDHPNFAAWTVAGQASRYAPFKKGAPSLPSQMDLAYWKTGLTVAGMT